MLRGSTAIEALEGVAHAVDGYLFGLDTAGNVVFAHPRVLAFLGRSPADLGQFTLADVIGGADLSWAARAIGRMFANELPPAAREFCVAGASGARWRFFVEIASLDTDEGESVVAVVARPLGAAA